MDLESILESLLFASNEPQTSEALSKIFNVSVQEIEETLLKLQQYYFENKRGLRLLHNNDKWLLSINPDNINYLNKLKKEVLEGDLSPAALETLSIVAYRGPISRAEINEIRGVDSSYILHQLFLRELIERFPHPQRSNVFLYQVSFKFLQHVGLNNIQELPNYEELHQKISNL